jgi:hypothetical protein
VGRLGERERQGKAKAGWKIQGCVVASLTN